jgi:hypothetical protein
MQRLHKAVLLQLRNLAYQWKLLRLYYWADMKVYELRTVCVLPNWYYRRLYHACVWLIGLRKFQRLANRAIHSIPFHVRFELA